MAFVTAAVGATLSPVTSSSKVCAVRGSARVTATPRRVAAPVTRMAAAPDYPSSDVLGLGKSVPSSLYAIASGPAFIMGAFSVYQSNIAHTLTSGNVDPQFIVGSLLLPISWGLHVAAFIQKENGK